MQTSQGNFEYNIEEVLKKNEKKIKEMVQKEIEEKNKQLEDNIVKKIQEYVDKKLQETAKAIDNDCAEAIQHANTVVTNNIKKKLDEVVVYFTARLEAFGAQVTNLQHVVENLSAQQRSGTPGGKP